ncbi:hypothetical protein K432DRAFT_431428 [Lepidopterella palustris CBS 459.81]|uniref:DUF1996 domain-containing protein n=1 Tax=Lepidopterella palustris CBS 459.81 TaxID=1314670 RepID=A0A8E2EKI7_9PEZI|nr:hypothetical protein K432DRAFT_431428 [Lepidopterella palustris CBS 459.81]
MFTNIKTSVVALAAGLAATGAAFDCHGPYFSFYNRGGPAMSYQRLDPALFPGVESPHLHSFDGGNNIAETMDFASTQASSCTTARIKADKSNYWRPTLFWNGNNTGFYRVPDTYLKIYYKFGDSGNVKANVSEFPENFRMIAGNSMLRHDDGVVGTNNGPGIGWSCKGENYASIDAIGFPKGFTSCPNGFAAQLTFPACWNGADLDPAKPSAHMAYPTAGGNGLAACPTGFQVARFPSIFIEFWYDVSAFDGHYSADSVPWVLAQGDPTGFGMHADFLNGWETGVLAKATADEGYCNCGCGCGQTEMEACFGTANVNDDSDAEFKACSASPEYPGDDASPLQKLPGCNPIQSGPADATKVTGAGCSATAVVPSGSLSAAASSASAVSSVVPSSVAGSYSAAASSSSATSAIAVASYAASSAVAAPSVAGKGAGDYSTGASGFSTATAAVASLASSPTPSYYMLNSSATASGTAPVSFILASSSASPSAAVGVSTVIAGVSSGVGAMPSGSGDCGVPVYVTVTPTVYVTLGVDTASSCDDTIYKTVTNTMTVTVKAGGL